MPLLAGTRLGLYEILAPIGAGGMGEVYRARDTKLKRDVALKVLPEAFARDPDRMARFQREAEVLAALNHPNIAHIYGAEDRALAMELVEGQTLKGPLPLETALDYARQIADAIEAAHEKGIVHRDLKPANIMITAGGQVKVLDFGLAAVMQGPAGDPAASPTLTVRASETGVIMGTAGYMSPEQASGKPVDKRADIWSFGVVLWEMLTGKRLFEGETVSHTLADVLRGPIDLDKLPRETPVTIRQLLVRCLDRDPKTRLRDIGEGRIAIQRYLANPAGVAETRAAPSRSRFGIAGWTIAVALAVALGVALWAPWRAAPPVAEPVRFQIPLPEKTTGPGLMVVSPDGRLLALSARGSDGATRHWVRALDALEARELPGSDTALSTTLNWSPDSRFIAYDAGGKLKKIDVAGGPAQTLCDLPGTGIGVSWNRDGVILVGILGGGIMRVSDAGGTPYPVTALDAAHKGIGHMVPSFLPDGRHFLYISPMLPEAAVFVGSMDVKPGEQNAKPLFLATAGNIAYVPSTDAALGRVLFVREKTLMSQAFDARRLELVGDAAPVAEQVDNFSVSENGVLVYRTGGGQNSQLTWLDRQGKTLGTVGDAEVYRNVILSPDATRAVVSKMGGRGLDLWLMDLVRGGSIRFTFDVGVGNSAVWSPDGTRIAYSSLRSRGADLYQKPVNGAKDEELLLKSNELKAPTSWSRDGRFLLYGVQDPKTKGDVWVLPLEGRKPTRLLGTEFDEEDGQFSPDGKWIAYTSDESGRNEVYVRSFSSGSMSVGSRSLVSKGGGNLPRWREDGKELFYASPDRAVMAVEVSNNPVFPFDEPKILFTNRPEATTGDFSGDGKRFLVALPVAQSAPAPFTVVLNWQAGLKK